MSDYDFKVFNDKEFEIFCADLLGKVEGRTIERFKPGKDRGIDGRFFSLEGTQTVLQCKHWTESRLSALIKKLQTNELPKLKKLNPSRYLLAISKPLSALDKEKIRAALSPYIRIDSDIYGKEDLNDHLRKWNEVERRHYKLWIQSSGVLEAMLNRAVFGRSASTLQEITALASTYVMTENHSRAHTQLEKFGAVIITGEPGVGKTTLAEHLCLGYAAEGYEFVKISKDVTEAEAIFTPDSKQLFFFDDFLGRNMLDALSGHEGNQITQFLRRSTSNKNKRFILTSRSTILNQGKFLIDSFSHINVRKNEYELKIASLSSIDKARIFYNHLWHSGLNSDHIDELYLQRRYRKVIDHKNFNPRLISYVTDPARLLCSDPLAYWEYVEQSLNNPALIWEHPFTVQQDDYGRALVFLVAMNGRSINERSLSSAFHRYRALPHNATMRGQREFQSSLQLLTGSFLNRLIDGKDVAIDLFNPSLGDYVLQRYGRDVDMLRLGLLSLRTSASLLTLSTLQKHKKISPNDVFTILDSLLQIICKDGFDGLESAFVCQLASHLIHGYSKTNTAHIVRIRAAIDYAVVSPPIDVSNLLDVIEWLLKAEAVTPEFSVGIVTTILNRITTEFELSSLFALMDTLPYNEEKDELAVAIDDHLLELIPQNLSNFVDFSDTFDNIGVNDYSAAESNVSDHLWELLEGLGAELDNQFMSALMNQIDVRYEFEKYYSNRWDDDSDYPRVSNVDDSSTQDELIEELFERG